MAISTASKSVSSTASAAPAAGQPGWTAVFLCWLIATVGTLGALFFSEVMAIPPCVLCWWQRIFLFPMVVMLPLALFPYDVRIVRYVLPLAVAGFAFAMFHHLLVLGYIPEAIKPCVQGVPCTEMKINWFGFLTIPLMSLLAFSAIIVLLAWAHFRGKK